VASPSSTADERGNPDEIAHRLALLCIDRKAMQEYVSRESLKEEMGRPNWLKKARRSLKGVEMQIEETTLEYMDALMVNVRFAHQYHQEVLEAKKGC
jgi:hypothetical protein